MIDKKVIDYKILRAKIWIKDKVEGGKIIAARTVEFCKNNPGVAIAALGTAASGFRMVRKGMQNRRDYDIEERRRYDPRVGEYVWSRRKLTPDEKLYVTRRYKDDSSLSYREIYEELGLNSRK